VVCARSYGKYQRSFDVSGIDTDAIKARYADGVLSLTLPKKAEVKPAVKRVTIE
jgi:HSP20 family protein